jgi:hypothetical protein
MKALSKYKEIEKLHFVKRVQKWCPSASSSPGTHADILGT